MRPSVGRPPVGPAVQVRFSAELLSRIDAWAAENHCSRAEAIRRLVTRASNVGE